MLLIFKKTVKGIIMSRNTAEVNFFNLSTNTVNKDKFLV